MTEPNYALEQAKAQYESVCAYVAALEVDYDRLDELKDQMLNAFNEQQVDEDGDNAYEARDCYDPLFREWFKETTSDESDELTTLLSAANDCENQDAARDRIQEDPLSVRVRSDWYSPGASQEPDAKLYEFEILLCSGGPAVRIIGELDEYGQPCRAWLEYQDWGTSWSHYPSLEDVLLTYCHEFYFGE